MEYVEDELAEKDLLKGGQANSAGVGDIDGDGEESLVKGGELETLLSVADEGLMAIVGTLDKVFLGLYVEAVEGCPPVKRGLEAFSAVLSVVNVGSKAIVDKSEVLLIDSYMGVYE